MQKSSSKQPVWKYKVDVGVRIDNYQWKVLLMNVFQIQLILVVMKKINISFIYNWWQWTRCMWFTCSHVSYILKMIWIRNISVCHVNSMGRHRWLCQAIYVGFGYIFIDCVIIFMWHNNGSCETIHLVMERFFDGLNAS